MADGSPALTLPVAASRQLGRRRLLYWISFILSVPLLGLLWLLVIIGVVPPTPTDDILSGIVLPALCSPFLAFWDDPGEHRTMRERLYEFSYVWLFMSGIAQTFWELPWFFFDLTGVVHNIGPEDTLLWPWWAYGVADTRYLTSNASIAGIEFCAGFAGPFELYACYLFKRGRRIAANWWALLLGVGLSWGAMIFFVSEIHLGFENIKDGAYGFWWKWIGLNIPWTFSPIAFIPASILELQELYEKRGVEKHLRSHQSQAAPRTPLESP